RRLAMGSILICGSEEQQRRWLPAMSRSDTLSAFALTEPQGGSTWPAACRRPRVATGTGGGWTARHGGSATRRSPTWSWCGRLNGRAGQVVFVHFYDLACHSLARLLSVPTQFGSW